MLKNYLVGFELELVSTIKRSLFRTAISHFFGSFSKLYASENKKLFPTPISKLLAKLNLPVNSGGGRSRIVGIPNLLSSISISTIKISGGAVFS